HRAGRSRADRRVVRSQVGHTAGRSPAVRKGAAAVAAAPVGAAAAAAAAGPSGDPLAAPAATWGRGGAVGPAEPRGPSRAPRRQTPKEFASSGILYQPAVGGANVPPTSDSCGAPIVVPSAMAAPAQRALKRRKKRQNTAWHDDRSERNRAADAVLPTCR